MNKNGNTNIQALPEDFRQLSYLHKLEYFHQRFGMIPFSFPKMDAAISWFYEEPVFMILTQHLREETRNRLLYEKTFEENESLLIFDIKPRSQSQRIQYNQFLLSLFNSEDYIVRFSPPESNLESAEDFISYLNVKCRQVRTALADIKLYLQSRNSKPGLKHQFSRVFYSGYSSYYSGTKLNLHVRHKFIELYLYSQGVAVADYLTCLQNHLRETDINATG